MALVKEVIENIDSAGKLVLSNILDTNTGEWDTYKEVSQYCDGSVMSDAKVDGDLYRKYKGKYVLKTLDLSISRELVVDTIEELRNLSIKKVILLRLGFYTSVSTKGYYSAGDGGGSKYLIKYSLSLVDDGFLIIKTNYNISGIYFTPIVGDEFTPRIAGARSNSVSNDYQAFQSSIIYAWQNNKSLDITGMDSAINTGLVIDGPIRMSGSMRNTFLRFNGMPSGQYAFTVCDTTSVNAAVIEGFNVIGTPSNNFLNLNKPANISRSVTDCRFSDIRAQNFNIGLKTAYAWCNLFSNIRFQSCNRPFEMGNQTNNTEFIRCSFVTYHLGSTFTNCEGINFTSCNFANFNLNTNPDATPYFMSLFQSNVSIINPYYEYVSAGNIAVGGSNELLESSFTSIGGKSTDSQVVIRMAGNRVRLAAFGLNARSIFSVESTTSVPNGAPNRYTVYMQIENVNNRLNSAVVEFDGRGNIPFTNYGSGASNPIIPIDKNTKRVTISIGNTGYTLTNNLVIGEWYTMVYAIRKTADDNLVILHNSSSVSLQANETTEEFEYRYVPFKAYSTSIVLRNATTGSGAKFDIQYLAIFKGSIVPQIDKHSRITNPEMPVEGTWERGEIVYNASLNKYPNIIGWQCTVAGSGTDVVWRELLNGVVVP